MFYGSRPHDPLSLAASALLLLANGADRWLDSHDLRSADVARTDRLK
jgi:hypothetical protein